MSRIGKKVITLPKGVEIKAANGQVNVKGPKGELQVPLHESLKVETEGATLKVLSTGSDRQSKSQHGLARTLINNAVTGVSVGFKKSLQIIGVGYKAAAQGKGIQLSLGYSHPVDFDAVPGVTFDVESDNKAKTNFVHVLGIDKQVVGQVAAKIRGLRPPEPYKGKGIRYVDEVVARKMGKAGKAK